MHGFDNSKYFHGAPGEQLNCLNEAAEFVQNTKELEQRFMSNVLRLSKAFNLCNSSKDFSQYELDLIYYYKAVRSVLFKLTKGDAPDADTMNAHVQKMLEEAIRSEGVEEVFSTDKDINAEAVDLFSDEYITVFMAGEHYYTGPYRISGEMITYKDNYLLIDFDRHVIMADKSTDMHRF